MKEEDVRDAIFTGRYFILHPFLTDALASHLAR
jgi:hypothetical protein